MVLRMALRMGEHLGPERERVGVRLAGPPPQRMTPARARVLARAGRRHGCARRARPRREAGVSAGVIDGLVDEGTLETLVLPPEPVARQPDPDHRAPDLTAAQRTAAGMRCAPRSRAAASRSTLLDGVTGSGKTEVYFEAVAETIRRGRQALILLPEIALTGAVPRPLRGALRRRARPNGTRQLAPRRRARTWRAVAEGEARVVVGARSALFLPFRRSRPDRRR